MGTERLDWELYEQLEPHQQLRCDIEETLTVDEQAELLRKFVKEFAGNSEVISRMKAVYRRHYDKVHQEWGE